MYGETPEPGLNRPGVNVETNDVETSPNLTQVVIGLFGVIDEQDAQIRALEALATSRGDDAATYQALFRTSLHALADEQQRHRREREEHERLIQVYEDLRQQVMLESGAAA